LAEGAQMRLKLFGAISREEVELNRRVADALGFKTGPMTRYSIAPSRA